MYRILIVENDSTIMAILKRVLEKWNYQMTVMGDSSRVLEWFEGTRLDLVLLDISLPFFNGYHWCGEMRRVSQMPIIFISSTSDDINPMMAVNMGADGSLTEPFKLEAVMAKIQALFRETYASGEQKTVLRVGGAVLNPGDGTLDVGSQKLELMKNELRVLDMLMERRGTVVSRDDMIRQLQEHGDFADDNALTVNVARLWRKLESVGLGGFIKTKKGPEYLASEGGRRAVES